MRQVFVHQDYTRVGLYQSVLDSVNIPSFIRNQFTNYSMAELPSPLFFPTLCVVRDDDYNRAMEILGELHDPPSTTTADWLCPKCGEEVPGTFESCWQCDTLRPDLSRNSDAS